MIEAGTEEVCPSRAVLRAERILGDVEDHNIPKHYLRGIHLGVGNFANHVIDPIRDRSAQILENRLERYGQAVLLVMLPGNVPFLWPSSSWDRCIYLRAREASLS